ncbi:MAG TPA: hypothetical protein VFB25_11815 [Gaiellaceae bacterium]|nr:hypothetical protein [Gaiellaceae bacterium]
MEIWLSGAFLFVAVVGSAAYAGARGWRLWRTFRRTSRRAGDAVEQLLDKAAAVEEHAVAIGGNAERLSAAAARLQESLAELAVLRAAVEEAREPLDALRGAVPTK